MGGGGGSSAETAQQKQLETEQALTSANLNLEENQQRKSILNSMLGTRVFRGSALSRAVVGNTPGTGGEAAAPAPSATQQNAQAPIAVPQQSLLDTRESAASGATAAGGAGASANAAAVSTRAGAYAGSGGSKGTVAR